MEAGLVGRRRALDSTPLYDASPTMGTVTLIRSGIRGLLQAADDRLERQIRAALTRDDDYASSGKPACDWDGRPGPGGSGRCPGHRRHGAHGDRRHTPDRRGVAGGWPAGDPGRPDLEEGDDGVYRIVRGVAPDRIISTVDTDARHGHKSGARGFDGYKGHLAVDPDSEIITKTAVTAGNAAAAAAPELLEDLLAPDDDHTHESSGTPHASAAAPTSAERADTRGADDGGPAVYGDAAYGSGELLELRAVRRHPHAQGAAAHRPERAFPQGPLPRRPQGGRSPARTTSPSTSGSTPAAAASPPSDRPATTARSASAAPMPRRVGSSTSVRGRRPSPRASQERRTVVARRLPRHAAEGRAQDRAHRAARTPHPGAGPAARGRGSVGSRGRHQPGGWPCSVSRQRAADGRSLPREAPHRRRIQPRSSPWTPGISDCVAHGRSSPILDR